MKKSFVVTMLVLAFMSNIFADEVQVGASVVFPGGGDVENGTAGWGVQGVFPIASSFSLELSTSQFGDSLDITEMSVLQFGSTLRWKYELSSNSSFYIGGGLNFNQFTVEIINSDVKVQMENVVGCHGVIGLDTIIKKRWVLFLDCRMVKLETTAVVSGYGQSEVVEGTYDHTLVRAGLNFLL